MPDPDINPRLRARIDRIEQIRLNMSSMLHEVAVLADPLDSGHGHLGDFDLEGDLHSIHYATNQTLLHVQEYLADTSAKAGQR